MDPTSVETVFPALFPTALICVHYYEDHFIRHLCESFENPNGNYFVLPWKGLWPAFLPTRRVAALQQEGDLKTKKKVIGQK